MITLVYNYFRHSDPARAQEIDACFAANMANSALDKIVIVVESQSILPDLPLLDADIVVSSGRPTYGELFDAAKKFRDGVCVTMNSDCFLDTGDTKKLAAIKEKEFVALLRTEIKSAIPLKVDFFRNRASRKKHEKDMQDCWAFKGDLPKGLNLDFCMGTPGCDNRLAQEFHQAGYTVINPFKDIRLYHLHRSQSRPYSEADRVTGPYYFPVSTPKGWLSI